MSDIAAAVPARDDDNAPAQKIHHYGMGLLRRRYGLLKKVAVDLGISAGTVYGWDEVPLQHVFRVAAITGYAPEVIRPDFFVFDPLRTEASTMLLTGRVRRVWRKDRGWTVRVLTEEHRRVWFDTVNHDTDGMAAARVGAMLGNPVGPDTLRRRFGPSGRKSAAGRGRRRKFITQGATNERQDSV